ncbi:MAG: anhydro-N-acetylmuramic acid kinase [Alphaproteobacteria bacterium]
MPAARRFGCEIVKQSAKIYRAIGLMSGTSRDGVDAALVSTDGRGVIECGPALTVPYEEAMRERLGSVAGRDPAENPRLVGEIAREITFVHVEAVRRLLAESGRSHGDIDVIGFHGHTVLHRPWERLTVQIGDGDLLAELTGIDVVDDFRGRDVAEGGQGAPLVPLFHVAMASALPRPIAILNLGGVANVTWIGLAGDPIAFDTGPGNALIDDWARRHTGRFFDQDGRLAAAGKADERILSQLLSNPYFERPPPKSLDRDEFKALPIEGLSPQDGAATLTEFAARAVALGVPFLPQLPVRWLISGGGRRNLALMMALERQLGAEVAPVEDVGWNGDALEAQAFAYLAVRSVEGLPLSLPSTTGVRHPVTGGRLHHPKSRLQARS